MNFLLKIIGAYFNTLSWVFPKSSARQAFHLFAFPFKAKLNDNQQAFLDTGEQFTVSVHNKNVQCYKWGSGMEKVLLVHGWQSNSYRWKSYIDAIDKEKYTVYSLDAPGHGNSEGRICNIPLYEESIKALLEREGDMDHFIGHSIGSFACASFMCHHDYAVKSYTSLASPFSAGEFVDNYLERIALSKRSQKYLHAFFEEYTNHTVSYYSFDTFSQKINPERVLIIHDAQDKSTPQENAIKFNALLKDAGVSVEMVLTSGLYHSLKSDEVVDRVLNFTQGDYTLVS